MTAVKIVAPMEPDKYGEHSYRFYDYPLIPFIFKFHKIAIEMINLKKQMDGTSTEMIIKLPKPIPKV